MRVWRQEMGLKGPPPFDPELQWFDSDYEAEARRVWDEEHPGSARRRIVEFPASRAERRQMTELPARTLRQPYADA